VIAREFDPTRVLDFFEQCGITKIFMVPAAMQFVVRQPRARHVDFSRLKYMLYGASPIPAALLKECIEIFKCGFVQMYGMTETTGTIVALPPEDHVEGLERMRSAGKALPGIELAILDADGNRLPPRQVGEIATRSGSNMAATGTCRKPPRRRFARTAGCARAMPATWTRTAISTSTTASRT
jgi:acyl-CoA synthetase (AMP-forming)/AMP-acid ligase II